MNEKTGVNRMMDNRRLASCTSKSAIESHYNLGNEFFRLWIGDSMVYSCALWEDGDTLEQAQIRKIDFHLQEAQATGVDRILDVGCGWGTLMQRAVATHNVRRAVGLTLSEAQAEWITNLHDPRIEHRIESWTEHKPEQAYDAIICIEAFEHFAKPGLSNSEKIKAYRAFFTKCHEWLKPGGKLSLQTGIYLNMDARHRSSLVLQATPETDLPTVAEIATASDKLFELVSLRNDRHHHEKTCRSMLNLLKKHRTQASEFVGPARVAQCEQYAAALALGCRLGNIGMVRVSFRRVEKPKF